MLTIKQIIQNYSDDEHIVIKIDNEQQGKEVIKILNQQGFDWTYIPETSFWQPPDFPYCLRIIYCSKRLVYGYVNYYLSDSYYIADAENFLQECTQAVEG